MGDAASSIECSPQSDGGEFSIFGLNVTLTAIVLAAFGLVGICVCLALIFFCGGCLVGGKDKVHPDRVRRFSMPGVAQVLKRYGSGIMILTPGQRGSFRAQKYTPAKRAASPEGLSGVGLMLPDQNPVFDPAASEELGQGTSTCRGRQTRDDGLLGTTATEAETC